MFVVDSSEPERFPEALGELAKLISEKELKDASLLILANKQVCILTWSPSKYPSKHCIFICCNEMYQLTIVLYVFFFFFQDIPTSESIERIADELTLNKLCCGRNWHIQACDAQSGIGLHEGLDWLSRQMVASGVFDIS